MAPMFRAVNQDFFKHWTSEMAYVVGFFAADGNMIRNKRGAHFIAFYNNDRILLEKVRTALSSVHKIGRKILPAPRKTAYQLQIGSKEIFGDLLSLGMKPAKSNTLILPRIPPPFHCDFVRGYFDGDGCVYFNLLKFADRKKLRHILMVRFTCGNRAFLEKLHALLRKHDVEGGSVRQKWKSRGFDLVLSHRDSLALYKLMYDTVPATELYLPRKYKIFTRAIKTLYPDAAVA